MGGLPHKSERKKVKAKLLLEDMSDTQLQIIQSNRQGFRYLDNPSLLNSDNPIAPILTKKGSKYLQRNNEYFIFKEKANKLVKFSKELNTKYKDEKLNNKAVIFERKLNEYNRLLSILNDPEKHGVKDKNQLKQYEKQYKKARKEAISAYSSLNKLGQDRFKKYAKHLQNSLNKQIENLREKHKATKLLLKAFKRVGKSISSKDSSTNKLITSKGEINQSIATAYRYIRDELVPSISSAQNLLDDSLNNKNPKVEDIQSITTAYRESSKKINKATSLHRDIDQKTIQGLSETKHGLYTALKLIDKEINKRTFLFSDKTEKKDILKELKTQLLDAFKLTDVTQLWKKKHQDVIKQSRNFLLFKTKPDKTGTEKFVEKLESDFSSLKL
ncbi:hypothetical protein E3983_03875 [Legionella israelensis]|uniref:Uncharacterized protein n=1 Tax=Legionella israelensis TaxID=454 RepID=A0AAX1EEN2_9GAMM|nr:hypothetical protein [Legionella israelensis]QBR83568.1 hypothetical protein E3983_03875 [Legionella israelensis]